MAGQTREVIANIPRLNEYIDRRSGQLLSDRFSTEELVSKA
jgi:hypothetical protein